MTERPEDEQTPEREEEQPDGSDPADFEDDPAYNPDDDELKQIKGG